MRLRKVLVPTLAALAWLGACSSDDTYSATNSATNSAVTIAATTAAPAGQGDGAAATVCQTDEAGDQPTVTIDVDDDSDGFGRFGLKVPSPLPAGTIRLVVNSVEDNADAVSITVINDGAIVFEFVDIESGVLCAADLDLAAGDYTVTFGDKTKTFTVDPQS